MLQGTKKFTVSTRANKASDEVKTVLTIDLNGCSEEVAVALAIQSAVIKRQGYWRKHGIPADEVIRLADLAPGVRHAAPAVMSKDDILARAKADPELRAELLKALQA